MSTLTSNDMHVKRSTTRVHNPPGGQTTISLNSWGEPEKKKEAKAAPAEVVVEDIKVEMEPEPIYPTSPDVIGLVVLDGLAFETATRSLTRALAKYGYVNTVLVRAPKPEALVRASQKLVKTTSAVLAVAFFDNDAHGSTTWSSVLNESLYQVGINADKPVVPVVIVNPNLLEAKGTFPNVAAGFARSVATLLNENLIEGESVAPVAQPPTARPEIVTEAVQDVEALMAAFRESLKSRGASGIFGLQRKFRIMDDDNSKSISLVEFTKAATEHTMNWTPGQVKLVFDFFDRDKSGSISFDEFIQGVRGQLNERRQQLVLQAFAILDADKSGIIELNDIKAKYDASKHPDVIAGRRTNDEVLREFLDTFDSDNKDGKVTPAEFCRYYANLSASIDEDDYFELMMRNAWHISGGEGWCQNTTCRRVLVTHADGHQSVEEIKNDLGIKADDKETMLARLREQGLTDITGIDLFGSVDNATPPAKPAAAAAPAAAPVGNRRRAQGGASSIVLG